jgi:P27 family predicted phage terminase small subunit
MTATKTNRPAPPDELDGEALLEWQRICEELDATGRLDKADRAILCVYVETWATWKAAAAATAKSGAVVKYSNGVPGQSPFYKTMRETAAQLRKLLSDLGLTPAARGKGDTPDDGGLEF